jgi:chromosome segregation ATPase
MSKMQKLVLGIFLAILVVQPAAAADKKDKAAREAQRRMAQMKQQMEAEKAELQAGFDKEKAELLGKVEQGEKTSKALKGSLGAAQRRTAELTAELEALRKEKLVLEAAKMRTETTLLETRTTLESTRKILAETQRDLKSNEAQRKDLSKSLTQRDQWIAACSEKNTRLHDFGLQLIKIYDKPSTYEAVMRTEPFVQTKRVELENILQDYRDKLDEQKVTSNSK